MAQEKRSHTNVHLVRRYLQAFAGGGVDAIAQYWDPDVSWRAIEGAPDDVGEMHGTEALRGYVQEWVDMFEDFAVALEDIREVGDGRVIAVQRLSGRAKISGAETDFRYAAVYVVRGDKIVGGREYMTLDEALAAVGRTGG